MKNRNVQRGFKEFKKDQRTQNNSKLENVLVPKRDSKNETVSRSSKGWTPPAFTAWKLILSIRIGSAVWSGVSDCDETYNYWEPTHHLIFGQALQTWEYDPQFALRSYLYLWIHAAPGYLYTKIISTNPVQIFYLTRLLLAIVCATSETYFYLGVVEEFGINVGRLTYALLCSCAGIFMCGTAFLPSTTCMYLTCVAYAAWFFKNYKLAIFASALSALLSWPFTCILAAPIALDILVHGKYKMFIKWSVLSAFVIVIPMMMCDSYYYGKTVFPTLNIVLYNVFTSHGPDLYGTEDWTFYLFNGILNFNFIFPAALISLPVICLSFMLLGEKKIPAMGKRIPLILSQLGLYLWLIVFWLQPHKEERFLFPIYPLILLGGALLLDTVQRLLHLLITAFSSKYKDCKNYTRSSWWLVTLVISVFALLSASRIVGLYQHYNGSMNTWNDVSLLQETQHTSNVCVGKEWHRFPSSFFLPHSSYRLGFLQSEFRGQLPKYYTNAQNGTLSTSIYHKDFNDQNLEEPTRYIQIQNCHYIVDLDDDSSVTTRQPQYTKMPGWSIISQHYYLNAASSHPLFRAFYVPFLDTEYCQYNKYVLLKKKSTKL